VGARASRGEILVFVDADTPLPAQALAQIDHAMRDPACAGGAPDVRYKPRQRLMRWYVELWRWLGVMTGMAQGSGQFCRRQIFDRLSGYDERIFVGEDVDFFWRQRRLARRLGMRVTFLRDLRVFPSSRRFDLWPVWRILIWTNPLFIWLFSRWRKAWGGWLKTPVR
jgi:cellulose synthase/poly-beta-1,6-N-acetylglucosamine synthase-like glycosyltransferase